MGDSILHVNSARHVGKYKLYVEFDDGTKKTVNVEPLLTGEVFEPLKEVSVFSKLAVDPVSKTVVWPNGADLAPEALYDLPAVEQAAS